MVDDAVMIRDMPLEERPREKLERLGAKALGVPELLAILLRVGNARMSALQMGQQLMSRFGLRGLEAATVQELSAVKGIGLAKACQLKAAFELGVRLAQTRKAGLPTIGAPQDAADLLMEDMRYLKEEHNSQIACASNSIYETIKLSLLHLGLTEYVDYFLSNEDVKNPKPHPEIYFKCMIRSNRAPKEVTIVEDSVVGLQAATRSGANVIKVNNRCDVNKKLFIPKARCTSWR